MKFLRNTHCECGSVKEMTDEQQEFWDKHPAGGFLVHMLSSKKPMTRQEAVRACKDYAGQFYEKSLSEEVIAHGLIVGCELGLIKVVL